MITAPGRIRSTSCAPRSVYSSGGWTLRIRSASRHNRRGSVSTCAPLSRKSSSPNDAPAPAPASTETSNPSCSRRRTVSGVAATRRSPGRRSRGMATFILYLPIHIIAYGLACTILRVAGVAVNSGLSHACLLRAARASSAPLRQQPIVRMSLGLDADW